MALPALQAAMALMHYTNTCSEYACLNLKSVPGLPQKHAFTIMFIEVPKYSPPLIWQSSLLPPLMNETLKCIVLLLLNV